MFSVFVDRKMAGSSHQVAVEEVKADPDVVEMKHRGLRRSASPELELAVQPQIPQSSVDCPICQGSFPVTEIEIHAAYCDGELAISNRRTTNTDSFRGDGSFRTPLRFPFIQYGVGLNCSFGLQTGKIICCCVDATKPSSSLQCRRSLVGRGRGERRWLMSRETTPPA